MGFWIDLSESGGTIKMWYGGAHAVSRSPKSFGTAHGGFRGRTPVRCPLSRPNACSFERLFALDQGICLDISSSWHGTMSPARSPVCGEVMALTHGNDLVSRGDP